MNTIRRRLTWRLLIGWTLLLLAGEGLAYWSARTALTGQFDRTLLAKAMALIGLTEQDNGRIELEFFQESLRDFNAEVHDAFFQFWTADGGAIVNKSSSLGEASLPLRYGSIQAPVFWDLQTPDAQPGRAVGLKYQPRLSDDNVNAAASGLFDAIVVVAIHRGELDRTLGTLGVILIGAGVMILGLTVLIVPVLLRSELAPLNRLAGQTQHINAQSLSFRFPVKGLPAELTPISRRLNALLERLQTAFERERQFSDDLAHEFRTPIAELRSLAELWLKWPDARAPDADQTVLAIAQQMESLINRFLAIARSDAKQVRMLPESLDLAKLLSEICPPYQARAKTRQLLLQCNLPPSLQIQSDPILLRSIVTNLVDNAVEYAALGGTIRIEAAATKDRFELRVVNPVEDLTEDDLSRLFDRFWRKDSARSSAGHSGLGLSLARSLASCLGYTLEASWTDYHRLTMTLAGPLTIDLPRKANSVSLEFFHENDLLAPQEHS